MNVNLPVWGYYNRNDSKFTDPLYVPYQKKLVDTPDGTCEVYGSKKLGSEHMVDRRLVRKGWGHSFMLQHPDTDQCPHGFTKGKDGWCAENEPEFGDHGLYSEHAFVAKHQYHDGYAPRNPKRTEINNFDMRSINPYTGNYVMYHTSRPSEDKNKYGTLASKDHYLA